MPKENNGIMVVKPKGVWKWKFSTVVLSLALVFVSYQSITLITERSSLQAELAITKAEILQYQLVYGKLNTEERSILTQTKAWFNETFVTEEEKQEEDSFDFQSIFQAALNWCSNVYDWAISLVD